MSNYNTNDWLDHAREQAAAGALITDDKPCLECGYSLRGLRVGGVCPECGGAIALAKRGPVERRRTLMDAPIPYVRLLQLGYTAMGLGGLLVAGVAVLDGVGRAGASAWMGVASAGLWVGGLAIVALPRPAQARRGAEDASWWALRIAALASQCAWLLLALWAAGASSGASAVGGAVAHGLALAGIIGFVPAFWLIKRMADWAEDPRYGDRALNAGIYLATLLVLWTLGLRLMMPVPVPNLRLMVGGVSLIAVFTVAAYGFALLQILREAQSASWTITKIREEGAKAARDAEQRKREWEVGESQREREGFGGPLAPPPGSMMGFGASMRASGHGGQNLPRSRRR